MKIAYLINHLSETGVNNVVLDLATMFTSHGHQCVVYYLEETERSILFPCQVIKVESGQKIPFEDYDIIHTHGIRPNVYVLKKKPWKKLKTKYIATLHCYVFQDFMDLYGKVKGFFYSILFLLSVLRHDMLIALSQDARHYYKRFLPWKEIDYSYNTRILDEDADLDIDEKRELLLFKKNGILIGMNGVLIKRKGIDIMLKALEALPCNYKVMFVGGDAESISKWVREVPQNLKERILFTGSRPKAYRYLKYYDIFALPSRSEGFPLAMVEAAAKGCRIVCSELPQLKEIFNEDEVSWCIVGDDKSLKNALLRATSLDGCKVYDTFKRKLSPNSFYQKHLDIYS